MIKIEQKNCSVYIHTSPNGKSYIGYTSMNPYDMWDNGDVYENNSDFYADIQKYGWENIRHEVLKTGMTRDEAIAFKSEQIFKYNSYIPEYGYNKNTDMKKSGKKSKKNKIHKIDIELANYQDCYSVYTYLFPNGKVYVGSIKTKHLGALKDAELYADNKELYKDIRLYGWQQIKLVIMCNNLLEDQRNYLKDYIICRYRTNESDFGYNVLKQARVENNLSDNFSVYVHIVPNGKKYIGITAWKPQKRWNNGKGYKVNKLFYHDINRFGWNKIQHIVICDRLKKEQALQMEKQLITLCQSNNPEYGYNQINGGEWC